MAGIFRFPGALVARQTEFEIVTKILQGDMRQIGGQCAKIEMMDGTEHAFHNGNGIISAKSRRLAVELFPQSLTV